MSGSLPRQGIGAAPPGGVAWRSFNEHSYRAASHRRGAPSAARKRSHATVDQAVLDLVACALQTEAADADRFVQATLARHSVDTVCLNLLTRAARHLGALWDDDMCTFADVTIGMVHLQQALHGLAPATEHTEASGGRSILLSPVPGEHHTFGLTMVQGFFRRAGWVVTGGTGSTLAELTKLARAHWFGVIGLSVGCEANLKSLARCVAQLRGASANRGVGIMVGGPLFVFNPGLARDIGADATAADGLQATKRAEFLLGVRPGAG